MAKMSMSEVVGDNAMPKGTGIDAAKKVEMKVAEKKATGGMTFASHINLAAAKAKVNKDTEREMTEHCKRGY